MCPRRIRTASTIKGKKNGKRGDTFTASAAACHFQLLAAPPAYHKGGWRLISPGFRRPRLTHAVICRRQARRRSSLSPSFHARLRRSPEGLLGGKERKTRGREREKGKKRDVGPMGDDEGTPPPSTTLPVRERAGLADLGHHRPQGGGGTAPPCPTVTVVVFVSFVLP
jgi:hypothetical protein